MKKVLVTGANGHVGFTLVKLLQKEGYAVRASVRDARDPERTERLRGLGVEVVSADLMRPDSLAPALEGIEGLFQVAAAYKTYAKDPQREIIDPSVIGGRNILEAAVRAGVKKVVFTSSIAAVGSDATEARPLTESNWNEDAQSPYFIAKTRAEKMAHALAREKGLPLVSINPGAIIGPGFYRHTPSTLSFELLLRGRLPLVFPTGLSFVDVRDVARAHLMAYESKDAQGRYLVVDRFLTMAELMKEVKRLFPEVKTPGFVAPKPLLGAVAFFDWMGAWLFGAPRQVTLAMVAELGGKYQRASSERIRKELNWEPMPFEQSLRDTVNWVRETFL